LVQTDRLIGGRYQILRKIAEGGMGAVFEAQHNLSKKSVALKILFPHIGKDEASRQRFLREVSAPAQIGHDNIVEVYDAGFDTQDGSLFVAMEFLQGEPFRDRLARGGNPQTQLLDWFEEILDPLSAAHRTGIVHRDLKPENIFLAKKRDGNEIIKLLDFGIARDLDSSQGNVTHTGIAMGTPHYMAPEQAMSAKGVTAAADVWAIGAMLYEALCGHPPFDGETASAIVVNACTRQHEPLTSAAPHVAPALAHFVDRCLSKEPQGRPQDAGQMLAELRHVRQQLGHAPAGPAIAGSVPATGVQTGPIGGTPHFAPGGTAMLPQQTPQPGYGTAPPGYPSPPPGYPAGQPGYQTGQPGYQTGQPGYQTGQPGYQTGQPGYQTGQPGYPTPPPGGYGTPAPGGGFASTPGSSPGFGTHPGFGGASPAPFGAPPSGYGTMAAAPKKSGGLAVGVIAAVLIGGLVIVGGGIAAAAFLLSDDGDDPNNQSTVSYGTVAIQTNVQTGELMVDGSSRGPVVPNQQVRMHHGTHSVEIREGGVTVATGSITVVQGSQHTLTLNRTVAPNVPSTNIPTNVMVPGNVQTFNGSLRRGDEQLQTGEYADSYFFQWTAGTTVVIQMDSTDFDTYLILKAPSGAQQDNDDREPGNLNAGITATLNETGRWQVMATSFSSGTTGDYTVTVRGP
jgi:serine/threonine-protein kinase